MVKSDDVDKVISIDMLLKSGINSTYSFGRINVYVSQPLPIAIYKLKHHHGGDVPTINGFNVC